jgi:hypothetical protein
MFSDLSSTLAIAAVSALAVIGELVGVGTRVPLMWPLLALNTEISVS